MAERGLLYEVLWRCGSDTAVLVLIPLAAAVLVVRKTPFGIYIEACGDNLDAAKNQGYVLFLYRDSLCDLQSADRNGRHI